jgi:hypothetical protein
MKTSPDFFLTAAGECFPLGEPRSCWVVKHMGDSMRQNHLVVDVWPIISLGRIPPHGSISRVVLSPRHAETRLIAIKNWPANVYVSKIVDNRILQGDKLEYSQVALIAWGRLHSTLADAATDAVSHVVKMAGSHLSFETVNVPSIRFLGDQDGVPEQELKAKVSQLCEADERVWKAYLVRADAGPETPVRVVLCLRTVMERDEKLAKKIAKTFAAQFLKSQSLDILFVNNDHEIALAESCTPFYVRTVLRST